MATYEVKGADGSVYHIEGPDDADPSSVIAQVTAQHQHKPQSLVQTDDGGTAPSGSPAAQAAASPVDGMSSLDKYRTGIGKGMTDLIRGAGQMIPWYRPQTLTGLITGDKSKGLGTLVSRQDVTNSRERDAPLMATAAGKAGDITGTVAEMLPAAFIPGANTMLGAAAIGAGSGVLAPSASTGETAANTLGGAAMGQLGLAAGRGAGALYSLTKAVAQPMFAKGQQSIASNVLRSMVGDDGQQAAVVKALQNPPNILPGVQPTTAQLANNGGLSQLQRSVFNTPEAITGMAERNQSNRAAMTGALDQIAGTDAQRASAISARTAATKPLYDAATGAVATSDEALQELLQRPSLKSAWSRAATLADERGDSLVSGRDLPERTVNSSVVGPDGKPFQQTLPPESQSYSGRALQYLKMALQDMTSSGQQNGIGAHEVGALKSTLADLNQWTAKNVPALRVADSAYADLSRPINQMDVGSALRDKLVPALGDFGNNTRLSANSYASALRNGDDLAANVTGQPQLGLKDVLNPGQMQTVNQIGQQLGRQANADELGRAVGSNTAQNLITQNLLRRFAGATGLPQTLAESTLAHTVLRPGQFAGKMGEEKIVDQLRKAALDPAYAAKLIQANPDSPIAKILWSRQGLLSAAGASGSGVPAGLLGNSSQQ